MLSELQKKKIMRQFEVFDADGNGYLEAADMDRIAERVASIRGWSKDSPSFAALHKLYEYGVEAAQPFMDDQGRVDRDAYLKFYDKTLNAPGAYNAVVGQLAEFLFTVLDADGDGQITQDEVRQFYEAYGIDVELAPEAFGKLDMNGDGHISKGEVTDAVAQFYFSSDPEAPGNWLLGKL